MRKILALFVAAVISLGVVGCGEEKKPAPPVAPNPPAAGDKKPDEKKPDAPAPAPEVKK